MSGLSAYATAGSTHNYKDETVSSSTRAREAARGVTAAITYAVPFLGQIVGEVVGNGIAKRIDAERDEAAEITQAAQKQLSALNSAMGHLETAINLRDAVTADAIAERDAAIEQYTRELFSAEGAETRALLEEYLPTIADSGAGLYTLTKQLRSEDKRNRQRAAHALELAQKEAAEAERKKALATDEFEARERIRAAQMAYNATQPGYRSNGITDAAHAGNVWGGFGTGLAAGGLAGAGAGVMSGLAATAFGLSATGVGLPIGLALGAIVGIIAGI